ncbi:hypothetical protein ACFQ07_02650, partial [Actinomadura adrarensis]
MPGRHGRVPERGQSGGTCTWADGHFPSATADWIRPISARPTTLTAAIDGVILGAASTTERHTSGSHS